jgi:hypothetical protein
MAARTTSTAIAGIIEVDEEFLLDPFIETANALVNEVCLDSDYSDELLELIERWLAAHFYCMIDPRSRQEAVRGIQESFEGRSGLGLQYSRYGQQTLVLDHKGNLAAVNNGKKIVKASILHIGGLDDWQASV